MLSLKDLPIVTLALQDIPKTLIQDGRNAALDYVKENQDAIYKLDGKEEKTPSLDKMKIVYSAYFEKSNQKKNSDRFCVYCTNDL